MCAVRISDELYWYAEYPPLDSAPPEEPTPYC